MVELHLQVNEITDLQLYNTEGKLIWERRISSGTETINVTGFSKGMYILKGNQTTEKIVIQ